MSAHGDGLVWSCSLWDTMRSTIGMPGIYDLMQVSLGVVRAALWSASSGARNAIMTPSQPRLGDWDICCRSSPRARLVPFSNYLPFSSFRQRPDSGTTEYAGPLKMAGQGTRQPT